MSNYLSKSDFKAARDCATKLYYKKLRYPNTLDDDPYMQMLADGGFMIGKFAQLLHPDGITVGTLELTQAIAETTGLMRQESATLFEPAFESGGYLARVDVLIKQGNRLQLIEVKSKSFDPAKGFISGRDEVRAEWREYIEDVAFQRMVLERAYPDMKVECFLLVPDKTALCEIDLLPTLFSLRRNGRQVEVDFSGDVAALRSTELLRLCPVDTEVALVASEVEEVAARLLAFVIEGPRKAPPQLGYICRECEYRIKGDAKHSGFRECWNALAGVTPSLLDFYQLGRIKRADGLLADDLIREGRVSLFDIPDTALTTSYAERQRIQLSHTRSGTEWRSPELCPTLERLNYPLHFVDFETSRIVLPYHRGMRPYEQVAFQWSCHTLDAPGAELRHSEWINLENGFPNVRFADALRAVIGDRGTILAWSHHESTTLKDIARQITDYRLPAVEQRAWLQGVVDSGRIFDLCAHALGHYFHPSMKGSVSIKAVLPAVWQTNAALREHPWFHAYSRTEHGTLLDPYATLPRLNIYEHSEVVTEGTGAMRAYQEMLYGEGRRNPAIKDVWRDLLLQYCKLDTLAMVMIWKHWAGA